MEIEARDRPARALPAILRASDEDDGPIELLHQAGCHDADDALVPILVPQDVAPPKASRFGQLFDESGCLSQDPVFHRLAITIELLEIRCELAGLVGVVGQDQLECGIGPTQPPCGVDPGREPKADRARVDRGRIDSRASHQSL